MTPTRSATVPGAAWLLARRDFAALFGTPVGWAALAAFLVVEGLFFWTALRALTTPGAPPAEPMELLFGGNLHFWVTSLLLVPLLCARVFAGERRTGVLDALFATPVSAAALVAGRFIALYAFYLCLWLPTLAYVALLGAMGSLDAGALAAGYLGVALVGAPLIAVSLLASALSPSALVAATMGAAALLSLYGVGQLEPFAAPGSLLREWLDLTSLPAALADFASGVVELRRVVFPVGLAAFALFCAARALEWRRLR